jgi:hypothetical protein
VLLPLGKELDDTELVGEGGDEAVGVAVGVAVGEFDGVNHPTTHAKALTISIGIKLDILESSSKYTYNSINLKNQFLYF